MASRKALLIAAAAMAIVMDALLAATAWPTINHIVAEHAGWRLGVDYTEWLKYNDAIPAGEALLFIYPPGSHNVVKVGEDSYNACVVPNNAQTWTNGDDIVLLSEPGKFFFICGMADQCNQGMKIAVTAY